MEKTLANERIALKYKSMIIKNIQASKVIYGQEIYGCNLNKIRKLKRIIDSAV